MNFVYPMFDFLNLRKKLKTYQYTCLLCLSKTMILRDTNAIIFANDVEGWSVAVVGWAVGEGGGDGG